MARPRLLYRSDYRRAAKLDYRHLIHPRPRIQTRPNPFFMAYASRSLIPTDGFYERMPVILPPETHDKWLSGEAGKEILRPFPVKEMIARPISKRINKPENNDPSVLEEGDIEQVERLI
jgi:putative SOS response-associated peptidase YedK